MKLSDDAEALLVATGTALDAAAAAIATTSLPTDIKLIISTPLAVVGTAILAFWKAYVNRPTAATAATVS